jgi:hypothetical protein
VTRAACFGTLWLAVAGSAGAREVDDDGSTKGGPKNGEPRDTAVSYGRDVRPILSDRCFECHGPDENARAAKLRLDERESATAKRRGRTAIAPGDVEASALVERIFSDDPDWVMPPPDSGRRPLSDEEKQVLADWIAAGAEYEEHWAFEPPSTAGVPELSPEGEAWARTDLDHFIARELERQGIEPAPQAEPIVLFRRLFLDLTGLPPSYAEILEFEADVERGRDVDELLDGWIDRLTNEEPYLSRHAEHLTRPWLDQARYADTIGIHTDNGRQGWSWRDWVLEAYRQNKPFDEFVIEQLAGDLLPEPTTAQLVATGFNRNHVVTDEGGAIGDEYLLEYAADRVETTGSVFLGLTVGCARCHDHKYDPITMEEYYSLIAFFNSNDEPGLYSQRPDANRAFEPFIVVPSAEHLASFERIESETERLNAELAFVAPEEQAAWDGFLAELDGAIRWPETELVAARSEGGATASVQDDGSVLFEGERPAHDVYRFTLRTDAPDTSLLLLEALPADGDGGTGGIGRADNGNAVIQTVRVVARSVAEPTREVEVPLAWAIANHEQPNGDFNVVNVLDPEDPEFWALEGHLTPGGRTALIQFDRAIGFDGGTEFEVVIDSRSRWSHHNLARPRLSLGAIDDSALALLPTAFGRWYRSPAFSFGETAEAYDTAFAPELQGTLDKGASLPLDPELPAAGTWSWSFKEEFVDDVPFQLETSGGREVIYLAREVFAPTPRTLELSLGSDDGFELLLDGVTVSEARVERGVGRDQNSATLELPAGKHLLVHKIVNTGGAAGAFFRAERAPEALASELVPRLYPERARQGSAGDEAFAAWRRSRSPRFAAIEADLATLADEKTALEAGQPRAMVMAELDMPRQTYVMVRGEYDHPDTERPVERAVPEWLGGLEPDAPRNRLGLAQWIVDRDNPLTARVTVNRLWEQVFGEGLVATGDDFGFQSEWPSHPELLDHLAVEFVDSGWDVRRLLTELLKSRTYRQSSAYRPELAETDPESRLLARFPRKRLVAEQIRDLALYTSGLLSERVGGPPVKPYQPDGLWREVAMLGSNTRNFEASMGGDLYRRSLYTFWKRASPPPSMMAFDAPTREFCVVERSSTDTPLQALVLLNDVQFVEASRALAERVLGAAEGDDERLNVLFRTVLTRRATERETAALAAGLEDLRARFAEDPERAGQLLMQGASTPAEAWAPEELATWTLLASSVLNLFEATHPR